MPAASPDADASALPRPRRGREGVAAPLDGLSAEEIAGFEALQERIGVRFRRLELLREAMTHASWNNERGEPSGPGHDNERLEYLGDAVLELVVGEYLFRRFPSYDEGQLTQLRAALVNTVSLARLGERLNLGDTLLLGSGAVKTGARKLPSLLANAFEAMTGAIFLDQGYRVATRVFIQNIGDLADWTDENHKGRLQEVSQERTGLPPVYRVAAEGGPGHNRSYAAEAVVGGAVVGKGRGADQAGRAAGRRPRGARRPQQGPGQRRCPRRRSGPTGGSRRRHRTRPGAPPRRRGCRRSRGDRRVASRPPPCRGRRHRRAGPGAPAGSARHPACRRRRHRGRAPRRGRAAAGANAATARKRTRRGHRGGRGRGPRPGASPS